MVLITNNTNETEKIGEKIGENLRGKEILALWGTMGMGKTALVRGIAGFFGLKGMVSSPTFAIMNEYRNSRINIYHFDMYRVCSEEDLESTGFYDYINKGIMIIEWSENIRESLPETAKNIIIMPGENENQRKIEIEGIKIDKDIVG